MVCLFDRVVTFVRCLAGGGAAAVAADHAEPRLLPMRGVAGHHPAAQLRPTGSTAGCRRGRLGCAASQREPAAVPAGGPFLVEIQN
eukprot:scaffold267182_cov16-Prasinocladus_malaysianus.AAC.1